MATIDPRKLSPRFTMTAERYAEIKEIARAAKASGKGGGPYDYRFRDLPPAEKAEFADIQQSLPSPVMKRQLAAEKKRRALLAKLAEIRDEGVRALSKDADLAR